MDVPEQVRIVEVSPRDGLQNESRAVSTAVKIGLINGLARCGLKHIEVSSFVSAKRVPQLADAEQVFNAIERIPGVRYSALVPNEKGLDRALAARVDQIAVFTAASETFCTRNIECSIDESLRRFEPVVKRAATAGISVRAYISCVLGCPYEGPVGPQRVADLARELFLLGCEEISLGDTIGFGTPSAAQAMIAACAEQVPIHHLAVHFHDTRGQALANILASLQMGITVVDASVAGLGGCPYAPGAGGNVATEDVVYMLHGMGVQTGVDLHHLIEVGRTVNAALGRDINRSRVGQAGLMYGNNDES